MAYPRHPQSIFTHPGGYTTPVPGTFDPTINPEMALANRAADENERQLAAMRREQQRLEELETYGRELDPVERMLGPTGSPEMVGEVGRAILTGGVGGGLAAGPVAGAASSILGSGGRMSRGARVTPSGERALFEENPAALDYVPAHAQQRPLERYAPSKPPKTIAPLFDPRVQEIAADATARGLERGATAWYNLDPIFGSYTDELGEEAGTRAFRDFTQRLGATSPQSKVDENIRRALWADWEGRAGGVAGKNPADQGVGHFAYRTGMRAPLEAIDQGIDMPTRLALLRSEVPEGSAPSKYANLFPVKTASFAENLYGNMMPSTIDIHNMRGWAQAVNEAGATPPGLVGPGGDPWLWGTSTTAKKTPEGEYLRVPKERSNPSNTEYPFIEQANEQVARTLGIEPGQTQAGMWMGLADETGVANPDIFMQQFNDVLGTAAANRGVSPSEAWRDFVHGRHRLYSVGGVPTTSLLGGDDEDELGPLP